MRQTSKMEDKSDIYFIELVLAGKQNAFAHLVDRHKDHAFNLAFMNLPLSRDPKTADASIDQGGAWPLQNGYLIPMRVVSFAVCKREELIQKWIKHNG